MTDTKRVIPPVFYSETKCDQCGNDAPCVLVGEEPWYETATACICRLCLLRSLAVLDEGTVVP